MRLASALHATVADTGSHVTSDLYLMEGDGPPTQLTSGAWSDRSVGMVAGRNGSAFLSDRITPGHQLPYTVSVDGEVRPRDPPRGVERPDESVRGALAVELVVYPRDGHVPLERAHTLDAIERTQAWFDRHLRS